MAQAGTTSARFRTTGGATRTKVRAPADRRPGPPRALTFAAATKNAVAPTRNGGRHCCQPPSAPSEGSAGVRQLWRPEGLLLLDPGSPAQASLPKSGSQSEDGFLLASAALLGPILFRAACIPKEAACRARKTGSSGASSSWSEPGPISWFIACRWRSDLPPRPRPCASLPALPGRLGLPSRSPDDYAPRRESLKAEKTV